MTDEPTLVERLRVWADPELKNRDAIRGRSLKDELAEAADRLAELERQLDQESVERADAERRVDELEAKNRRLEDSIPRVTVDFGRNYPRWKRMDHLLSDAYLPCIGDWRRAKDWPSTEHCGSCANCKLNELRGDR